MTQTKVNGAKLNKALECLLGGDAGASAGWRNLVAISPVGEPFVSGGMVDVV